MPVDSKGGITFPKNFREECSGKVVVKEANGCLKTHPLRGNPRRNILLGKSIGEVEESFLIKRDEKCENSS
ncbi:MAG: hypothetical protein QW225_08235 [Candidatus Jordarchaeales archaeon]